MTDGEDTLLWKQVEQINGASFSSIIDDGLRLINKLLYVKEINAETILKAA